MTRTVVIKKDEESGEYYFDMKELEDLFEDASIIDQYSMEWQDDGSVVLAFFDKDNNKIIPKKV